MGRQKGDPNRSKSRPSSSSSAASLLQTSNSTSVGFGGYVGNTRIDTTSVLDKDNHVDVDGEAALHLRRLSKKDPTTRLKALAALGILFKERPANELSQLLPNWIFEYKRLVQDDSRQVREGAHDAMASLALAVGRGLAPHLRTVMGAWWVSQFDPSREVSEAAQRSFQVAFSGPPKRVEALMFCANEVLVYMDDMLKSSPQTISEKSTPIEESAKKYELVISSVLLALAAFLDVILARKTMPSSGITSIENGAPSMPDSKNDETRRTGIEDLAGKFCLNHKVFRDFAKSKSSQIRSASYQALRAVAQNVPVVFNPRDMETVSGIVLGAFVEKDPACHPAMWDMILLVSQRFPQAWDTVSVRKFVLPRLWAFLRHAAYGSAQISYPCILPLLCLIPIHTVKPAMGFLKEFFNNLWEGHNSCLIAVKDERALLKAIQECFLWVIDNAVRFAEEDILPEKIQHYVIENVLLKLLWSSYVLAGRSLPDFRSPGFSDSQAVKNDKEEHESSVDDALFEKILERDQASIKEKFPDQFIKDLRMCIIELLAVVAAKGDNLSSAFWNSFQDHCLATVIHEAGHRWQAAYEGHGCVSRISVFFLHLGQLFLSDGKKKEWLLIHAVRPLISKLFPVVKSTEYKEAILFIATIVSIFGPTSFSAVQAPDLAESKNGLHETKQGGLEDEKCEEMILPGVFGLLRNELTPWCLDGNEMSSMAKIELLLSFFEDERCRGEWDQVLVYATTLESDLKGVAVINVNKVAVLATLVEKLRIKFSHSFKLEDFLGDESQAFKQWNLSKLDGAAIAVASSISLSHQSCLQLLRYLVGGSDNVSPPLLSKQATEQVIRLLLQRMSLLLTNSNRQWARYAALSILPPNTQVPLLVPEEDDLSMELACSAVHALCSSIFCVIFLDSNSDIASKVVASVFCLCWEYSLLRERVLSEQEDLLRGNDTEVENDESFRDNESIQISNLGSVESCFDKDVALFTHGAQHETEKMSKMLRSVRCKLTGVICTNLSALTRMQVQQTLGQCVRFAVFEELTEASEIPAVCANWVLDLVDQICNDREETEQLLDLLFKPALAWPVCTDFSVETIEFPKIQHKQMDSQIQEARHTRFVAFVDRVAAVLGWDKIVLDSMLPSFPVTENEIQHESIQSCSSYRVCILIELLCTWRWPGGNAMHSVLPFLESCARQEVGSPAQTVVDNIVYSLFSAASARNNDLMEFSNKFWMGLDEEMDCIVEPCLRALLVVLKKLLGLDSPRGRLENAQRLFDALILDQRFYKESFLGSNPKILPYVLTVLVPILRKRRDPLNEPNFDNPVGANHRLTLEAAVCKWLELALSGPPLSILQSVQASSEVEHWVRVAVSCFPLHPAGGAVTIAAASSAYVSPQERALLLALLRKQASREAVAGYLAYAAEQRVSAPENQHEKTDCRQAGQATLAKLVAATVAYCWQELEEEDWAFVISHVRKWLEAAVLEAEDFTELVANIVKEADQATGKDPGTVAIVANLESAVTKAKNSETELTWTAVAIFSLIDSVEKLEVSVSSNSLAHLHGSNWGRAKLRAVEDILRIFFATGLAESVAFDCDAGESAGAIIAVSRKVNSHLWENISEIVLNVSDREKTAAARSVDLWGVGKGAVRALYALLFSPHPIGALQLAAYSLLSSDPFQQLAVTHESPALQHEQSEEEALNTAIEEPSSSQLAKIRRELADVLETVPAEPLESSLVSPIRVRYFLGWAIFLSHLHSLSGSSAASERLVQYAQDSNISSALLDSLFQHIPLKPASGAHGGRKKILALQAEIGNVEAAARRAAASGSISFAVDGLWPLEKEAVSILAGAVYGLILQVLPACVRVWFTGLRDRSTASAVEAFTTAYCSPQLLAAEFSKVQKSAIADESLTIKANQNTREVTAIYKKEEAGMDMVIRLPPCYPLRAVDVDCTRRLGISETRLRKWMLSMAAFLRNQNGAVAEAIQIWKRNVDREFEGVEECPICYSIIHTTNHSLPRLACKTCRHKFHAACLYKWFSTSHKSTCPLCQTPF